MTPLSTIAGATLFLLVGATAARADVITTFTLHDIMFADGGTASGSSDFDSTPDDVYSSKITTSTTSVDAGVNDAVGATGIDPQSITELSFVATNTIQVV